MRISRCDDILQLARLHPPLFLLHHHDTIPGHDFVAHLKLLRRWHPWLEHIHAIVFIEPDAHTVAAPFEGEGEGAHVLREHDGRAGSSLALPPPQEGGRGKQPATRLGRREQQGEEQAELSSDEGGGEGDEGGAAKLKRSHGAAEKPRKEKRQKKEKKEKREKREKKEKKARKHKSEKHRTHKRHTDGHRSREEHDRPIASPVAACLPSVAQPDWQGAEALLTQLVKREPQARSDLGMILQVLDRSEAIVLSQVDDSSMRTLLESLSECLGLSKTALAGNGGVAHSKPAHLDVKLVDRFAFFLEEEAGTPSVTAVMASEPICREDEVQQDVGPPTKPSNSGRKVYGAMLPPGGLPIPFNPIGPSRPTAVDTSEAEEVETGPPLSPSVGPRVPLPEEAMASENAGTAWWQKEQAMPKMPTQPASSSEMLSGRDEWMTSLPTDRASQSAETFGVSRTFLRNDRQQRQSLSASSSVSVSASEQVEASAEWTQDPATRDTEEPTTKHRAADIPMSLAEVAALAAKTRAQGGARRPDLVVSHSEGSEKRIAPKSLVELHEEAQKKQKKVPLTVSATARLQQHA
ncbi:MAG: hypothetical protein SGPRY_010903 [Prymnesium sp.]